MTPHMSIHYFFSLKMAFHNFTHIALLHIKSDTKPRKIIRVGPKINNRKSEPSPSPIHQYTLDPTLYTLHYPLIILRVLILEP